MWTRGERRGRKRRSSAELLCGVPRAVCILAAALPGMLSRASVLTGAAETGCRAVLSVVPRRKVWEWVAPFCRGAMCE